MNETDKLDLLVERILQESFMQQDGTEEGCCPLLKTCWILKSLLLFYDLAVKAVNSVNNVTCKIIQETMGCTMIRELSKMKYGEVDPTLKRRMIEAFDELENEFLDCKKD